MRFVEHSHGGGPRHWAHEDQRGVLELYPARSTSSTGSGQGIAYAEHYQGSGNVAVVFFGDGTANRGQFHEALNFAGLRKLPIIFFCENNGWGLSTPTAAASAVVDIARRAAGYDMPGVTVDGREAADIALGIPQANREIAFKMIPLGRGGTPEEGAGAVLFFCSPLSNYVSGQVLEVTGGL